MDVYLHCTDQSKGKDMISHYQNYYDTKGGVEGGGKYWKLHSRLKMSSLCLWGRHLHVAALHDRPAQSRYGGHGRDGVQQKYVRDLGRRCHKDLKQKYSLNDFKHMLKLRRVPIGLLYEANALFSNMSTCVYKGRQVEHVFECVTPSMEDYFTSDQNGWASL